VTATWASLLVIVGVLGLGVIIARFRAFPRALGILATVNGI
jgi:hypothetical protein